MAGMSFNNPTAKRFVIYATLMLGSLLFLLAVVIFVVMNESGKNEQASSAPQVKAPSKTVIKQVSDPVQMVEVVVPVRNISQGEELQQNLLAKVSRPVSGLSNDAGRNYEDLAGKYAKVSLTALEPVNLSDIGTEQPVNIIADKIPNGYRAVTISVNATTGVEGWASPGAMVDVHWLTDINGKKAVVLLVQNAKVLSAERQVDPAAASTVLSPIPTTVTLLVSERDAQKVSLAVTAGSLVLHLRGADSGKVTSPEAVVTEDDMNRGRNGDAGTNKRVDAVVVIKRPDGTVEELALIDKKLMTKVN